METTENNQPKSNKIVILDAQDKILGRIATEAASLLMGKDEVGSRRNKLRDIKVVVINTDTVALSGNKEEDKLYRTYSGYPGGLREISVGRQREKDSRKIVELAVFGMLPKNKMRPRMMTNLLLFAGGEHPYKENLK
jgi:large subunit ribosomal protein L13